MLRRTILRMKKSFLESMVVENWNTLYSKETTIKENKKLEKKREKLHKKLGKVRCKLNCLEKNMA